MRYLILIVAMLIPASGWAGGDQLESFVTMDKVLEFTPGPGPVAVCDLDYKNCQILEPAAFHCYQKMREAMKSIDKYVNGQEEFYSNMRGWRIGSVIKDQWNQTITDCVEGT